MRFLSINNNMAEILLMRRKTRNNHSITISNKYSLTSRVYSLPVCFGSFTKGQRGISGWYWTDRIVRRWYGLNCSITPAIWTHNNNRKELNLVWYIYVTFLNDKKVNFQLLVSKRKWYKYNFKKSSSILNM